MDFAVIRPVMQPVTQQPVTANDTFKIERENDDSNVFVRLLNSTVIETLRRYLSAESLYEHNPKIPAHELFLILPELRKAVGIDSQHPPQAPKNPLRQLVDWIEIEYESKINHIKKMTDNNVISYNNLFYLFPKDQHIRAEMDDRTVGAKVIKVMYNRKYCEEFMTITAQIIDSDGVTFTRGSKIFYINHWDGVFEIEKLPVVPLPKESPIRDELVERGRKFTKYAIGPHYLQYTGNLFRKSWFTTYFKAEGRVMVDAVSFSRINPGYDMGTARKANNGFGRSGRGKTTSQIPNHEIREEELFMCVPSLYGFSFVAKKWGQIYVDQLDDITFDDDAFDQLVMDPTKKELISSLVTSKHKGMDLISGKGGGCIFLLHGPPGVGKTLTAEAISEYLHHPLYAVSVGELGTNIVDLEKKLSEILEVASVWDAVILIDEADIFLERRSEHDINRNALVSIFLRLLEYHQGILFLTTNRVKCFDAAFQSRISVALKYNELDADAREQVWRTFLNRAEGKDRSQVNIENLKQRPLNGREIKTAIRLAKALATKNDPDALITTEQLETILEISKSFSEEILEDE